MGDQDQHKCSINSIVNNVQILCLGDEERLVLRLPDGTKVDVDYCPECGFSTV